MLVCAPSCEDGSHSASSTPSVLVEPSKRSVWRRYKDPDSNLFWWWHDPPELSNQRWFFEGDLCWQLYRDTNASLWWHHESGEWFYVCTGTQHCHRDALDCDCQSNQKSDSSESTGFRVGPTIETSSSSSVWSCQVPQPCVANDDGVCGALTTEYVQRNEAQDPRYFIEEKRIDDKVAEELCAFVPHMQRQATSHGSAGKAQTSIACFAGHINYTKLGADANVACARRRLTHEGSKTDGLQDVERFIEEEGIDDEAARDLLALEPHMQRYVMGRGSLARAQNPSACLIGRIRDARREAKTGFVGQTIFEKERANSPRVLLGGPWADMARAADNDRRFRILASGGVSRVRDTDQEIQHWDEQQHRWAEALQKVVRRMPDFVTDIEGAESVDALLCRAARSLRRQELDFFVKALKSGTGGDLRRQWWHFFNDVYPEMLGKPMSDVSNEQMLRFICTAMVAAPASFANLFSSSAFSQFQQNLIVLAKEFDAGVNAHYSHRGELCRKDE